MTERKPHLVSRKATLEIQKGQRVAGVLSPALNSYPTMREPLGTPAVKTSMTHDLYLTLMNLGEDGSIGLRAIVTPAVVWIWIGVLVMVAGTALCLVAPAPSRAYRPVRQPEAAVQ